MSTSPSLFLSLVRPLAVVLFFALAVMPVPLLGIDGPWLGPGAPSMRGRHDLPAHFRTDFFTAFDSWFADRIGLRLVLIRIGTGFHVGVLQRPITLAGFFALGRRSRGPAIAWLALASLFFYGWWNPVYVDLLLRFTFNYLIARCLHFLDTTPLAPHRKLLLTLAVGANLGLLAYYKYTGFFLRNLNALSPYLPPRERM